MLNRVTISGRIGRDLELKSTQSGVSVVSFSLAVDRDFKDKANGERATDWIGVVAWRSTAEYVCRYGAKGRQLIVDGRLQVRDWTNKDGNKRRSVEVVADSAYLVGSRNGDAAPAAQQSGDSYMPPPVDRPTGTEPPPGQAGFDGYDDPGELPF